MLTLPSCGSILSCWQVVWWRLLGGCLISHKRHSSASAISGRVTGAAAALVAAAELPALVAAVVSRGGRPDLAGKALRNVAAPTLLIVGGRDSAVLELNRKAFAELPGEKKLEIVPGATHLFEEPGSLESVAQLARNWFALYLSRISDRPQTA